MQKVPDGLQKDANGHMMAWLGRKGKPPFRKHVDGHPFVHCIGGCIFSTNQSTVANPVQRNAEAFIVPLTGSTCFESIGTQGHYSLKSLPKQKLQLTKMNPYSESLIFGNMICLAFGKHSDAMRVYIHLSVRRCKMARRY